MMISRETVCWLQMAGFLLIDSGSRTAVREDSASYLGRGRATYRGHLGMYVTEPTPDVVEVKEM